MCKHFLPGADLTDGGGNLVTVSPVSAGSAGLLLFSLIVRRRGGGREGGEGSESLTLRLASAVCPVPTTSRFDPVQTELIKNEY